MQQGEGSSSKAKSGMGGTSKVKTQILLAQLEEALYASKAEMQMVPGTDKVLIDLLKQLQQPSFAPEPTELSKLLLLLAEATRIESQFAAAPFPLSSTARKAARQAPPPPPPLPSTIVQPLMAVLRAVVCGMQGVVQGISALSLAWVSKLAPPLASLAVYRAAAEQDNADALVVLKALIRQEARAVPALACTLQGLASGKDRDERVSAAASRIIQLVAPQLLGQPQGEQPTPEKPAGSSSTQVEEQPNGGRVGTGSRSAVQLLPGAGSNGCSAMGGELVEAVVSTYHERMRQLLASGADTRATSEDGFTALTLAVLCGLKAEVSLLLQHGAVDVDAVDAPGCAALHAAAVMDDAGMLRMLLRHGACLEARNGEGHTAAALAAQHSKADCLRLLLDAGADGAATSPQGLSCLHMAARAGSAASVSLLIARGVSLTARDSQQRTPLHWAAASGSAECARLLIEAGAPLDSRDGSGRTPAECVPLQGAPVHMALLHHLATRDAGQLLGRQGVGQGASEAAKSRLQHKLLQRQGEKAQAQQSAAQQSAAQQAPAEVDESAELAAQAAAQALLSEEEQSAARAAAKAAKRQRKKERQQAQRAQQALQAQQELAMPSAEEAEVGSAVAGQHPAAYTQASPPSDAAPTDVQAISLSSRSIAEGAVATDAAAASCSSDGAGSAPPAGPGSKQKKKRAQRAQQAQQPQQPQATAAMVAPGGEGSGTVEPPSPSAAAVASQGSDLDDVDELLRQMGIQCSAAAACSAVCSTTGTTSGAGQNTSLRTEAGGSSTAAAAAVHVPPAAEAGSMGMQGTPNAAAAAQGAAPLAPAAPVPAAGVHPSLLLSLECPITQEVMQDPVMAADGVTYERAAIEAWMARQATCGRAPSSPATNQPLASQQLLPNHSMRAVISSLRDAGQLG